MADIAITPANVLAGSGASLVDGVAGATLQAGQVAYRDAAASNCKLADSNAASPAARSPYGIALHGAALGQPVKLHRRGPITIGAVLVPGATYYLSDTPGGICPAADVGSGEYSVIVGIAKSASILDVEFHESGVAL